LTIFGYITRLQLSRRLFAAVEHRAAAWLRQGLGCWLRPM
jgi:hypothetical protein